VASADRVLAGVAALLLGLAYGLCLVSGLRQAEYMASPDERGAVIACYYAWPTWASQRPTWPQASARWPGRPARSSR